MKLAPPTAPGNALAIASPQGALVLAPEEKQALHEALEASRAPNTVRAYAADWKHFCAWCEAHGATPLPASEGTVGAYLSGLAAEAAMATVVRHAASISVAHQTQGLASPTRSYAVRAVLRGLRRKKGVRQQGKRAADSGVVKQLLAQCPKTLKGTRDSALLLMGYATALRRSALCALDVEDVTIHHDRLEVLVRRGKEDQTGIGRVVAVLATGGAHCPVLAYKAWLRAAGITTGAIFRGLTKHGKVRATRLTPGVVATVLQGYATAAGLDSSLFGAHSLRAGHVTEAARRGARIDEIMNTTGHHSVAMVLRYVREADPVRGSSAGKLGLSSE